MIIHAKHNAFLYPFFKWYVLFKMKRSFSSVEFSGKIVDKKQPVLVIGNHVSWWDGIWALYLNQEIFQRKFHFMMQEEQLRKNWFFRFTGGYSVKKGSRSAVESIVYTEELLENPQNLVLMFPQGKIQSMHRQEFVFEKGIDRILKQLKYPAQVVFMAGLVDYFSGPKPQLTIYMSEYEQKDSKLSVEQAYNSFYRESVENQSNKES